MRATDAIMEMDRVIFLLKNWNYDDDQWERKEEVDEARLSYVGRTIEKICDYVFNGNVIYSDGVNGDDEYYKLEDLVTEASSLYNVKGGF